MTLWTDVDGIYSADPRVVPNARKLHRLPNEVAKELGRLGNPVLHAKTLKPLSFEQLPHTVHLHVASSFAPEVLGSEIGSFGEIAKQELSVTRLNDLLLIESEFLKTEQAKIAFEQFSVEQIDHELGFVVVQQHTQQQVTDWLASSNVQVRVTPIALVAAVGHNIAQQGNMFARFKRATKSAKPLRFIQSSNNHSIIAVLKENCTIELLNRVHHAMTKDARHIGLVVAGLGNIGEVFLSMLPEQLSRHHSLENTYLVGLLGSKKALIRDDGINPALAKALYEQHANDYDKAALMEWLGNHPYDELIVVDLTPSEEFSDYYQEFFAKGIHVIGANKWAASADTPQYNRLLSTASETGSLWYGNTTVGAGLPVNYALNDLARSGDKVIEISGIFSGTLSWLFESYDASVPFSTLLKDARNQGLTEPDPREDLSGKDVQRKLLILARLAGFELSLSDISVQNLVPEALQTISIDEFLARCEELDDYFEQAFSDAKAQNQCIRYVAKFAKTSAGYKAEVCLAQLGLSHAFASLTPCDNIFQIKSQWYHDNPLIIRGPGAGREVTAGGVHSDLVVACQTLNKKSKPVEIRGIN